jgi:hypothetical protein
MHAGKCALLLSIFSITSFISSASATPAGSLFQCLSNPTCTLSDYLCTGILSRSQICDGATTDCGGDGEGGKDERKELCEDERWLNVKCADARHIRCLGNRPGQCVAIVDVCDGKYDCVDRSDENDCGKDSELRQSIKAANKNITHYLHHDSQVKEGEEKEEEVDEEEEKASVPSAVLITFLFLLVGIPVTFFVKWVFVGAFVKHCAVSSVDKKKRDLENDSNMVDGDVAKMLHFIFLMVDHIEKGSGNDDQLYALFSEVHRTSAWDKSATVIFDMAHLLFDADQDLIDAFHISMYEMEERLHGSATDNGLEMNLCLKRDLGNAMAYELFYSVEPPCIRKCSCIIPECFKKFWRCYCMRVVRIYFFIAFDLFRYYMDLIKDWIIFFILFLFVDHNSFWTLEMQLVFLLGIFLIVPEFIRGAYFAHHYKTLFGIRDYKFEATAEIVLKIAITILSPFVPAILLMQQARVTFQIIRVQKKLHNRIESCMKCPVTQLDDPDTIENFKVEISGYHEALRERDKLLGIAVDAKYLESSTETIFQYILQLIVVLVVANATQTSVADGFENVFFSVVGALLYLSLALSFVSMIYTRMKLEKRSKQGFFRSKAKLLFGLHSLICLSTKICGIVFYFAPALGLFHMGAMWDKEQINYKSNMVVDHNDTDETRVADTWSEDQGSTYARYTLFSLTSYYVFFLVFVPAQCLVVYMVKQRLVPSFRSEKLSSSKKILHTVSCITFPTIYEDWDIKVTEDIQVYEARWIKIRKELRFMSIWHCAINVFQSLPLVYCCVAILLRNRALQEMGFSVLSEEEAAVRAAFVMVFMPLFFVVLAFVEWKVLRVYYNVAHPWASIFKEFECNKAKKGDK